jgi:hypothetical protein
MWHATWSGQVDLGMAVAEHVHMCRFVIIEEDDHPQAGLAQDGDHD